MVRKFRVLWGMKVLVVAMAVGPAALPAQSPHTPFTALRPLEAGLWQLDSQGRPPQLLCVTDPTALFQIAHAGPACQRFVIANTADEATVHYSCGTAGWGRTTVRVTTPRAVQIFTQGIKQNRPYDFRLEAHRVGACQAATAAEK